MLIDHFLEDAIEVDVDALCDGEDVVIAGIMQHIEEAGIHSGDSSCVLPAVDLSPTRRSKPFASTPASWRWRLNVIGLVNLQFAIQRRSDGQGIRHRGESSCLAHGALCLEGDGRAAGEDCFAAHDRTQAARVAAGAGSRAAAISNRLVTSS